MRTDEFNELARALDELADEEKAAILGGDLSLLADLSERKSDLVEALNAVRAPVPELMQELQSKLARNQELLNSALDGLRSVRMRLSRLQDVRKGLSTYDAQGRRQRHGEASRNTLERRA